MTTRSLTLTFLVFLAVAGALIVALLAGGEGDESVSGPAARVLSAEPRALPGPAPDRAAVPLVTPAELAVADVAAALDVQATVVYTGRVSGRLIDPAGRGVAGEPLRMVLTRDPWHPEVSGPDDEGTLIGKTVSDAEGRFELPSQPGALHTVLAAGEHWPGRKVPYVATGDELLLTLEDGLVLEGVVYDEETGLPVPEAHLLALHTGGQLTGVTDESGHFSLGPLPPEDVFVAAYAAGYDLTSQGDVSPAMGLLELELPPGIELVGRVVERGSEAPVPEGEVRFSIGTRTPGELVGGEVAGLAGWVDQRVEERVVPLAADGSFELGLGPRRGFNLEVTAPGYVPHSTDRYRNRPVPGDGELFIALQPVQSWTGAVVDALSGAPVGGVRLTAEGRTGLVAMVESAADGSFAVPMTDWDGEGPVYITARTPDGRGARVKARSEQDGSTQELLLELVAPLRCRVTVMGGGVPLAAVRVGIQSQGSETTEVVTDGAGTAPIEHLLAGPFASTVVLQARHEARESLPLSVEVAAAPGPDDAPLVLDLDLGGDLVGLVTDSYGTPIPAAQVWVKDGQRGYSDPRGAFRLGPLDDAATHELHAVAEGHRATKLDAWVGATALVQLTPVVTWSGRALDAVTGLPVEGFSGWLEREVFDGAKLKTQRVGGARMRRGPKGSGEFTLELPTPGRYMVKIWAKDYLPAASVAFEFNGAGEPPPQDLRMEPASVLVVRLAEQGGAPVQGVTVTVMPLDAQGQPDKRKRRHSTSNASGEARFNLGSGGLFVISSGSAGVFGQQLSVPRGVTTERHYSLPLGGTVEVRVTDELGRGAPGARVRFKCDGKSGVAASRKVNVTRADGVVLVDHLPPGDYAVTVSRRGATTLQLRQTVVSGRTHVLDASLEPRGPSSSSTMNRNSNSNKGSQQKLR